MTTQIQKSIEELKALWTPLFPGVDAPDDSQWALWFLRHDPTVVRQGIVLLATKYRKLGGAMDELYMQKFASSVMNRLSIQRQAAPGEKQ